MSGGEIEVKEGKTYLVNHSRKGTFAMSVETVTDEWATGHVVGGTAKAIMGYNVKEVGEPVTVRRSFCTFTEQP